MHIYRRRHSVATTLLALAISVSGCSLMPSIDNSIESGDKALSSGHLDKAEQSFQQAIGEAEKTGKKDKVAQAKVGLADTYVEQEIYDDAETLYEDALELQGDTQDELTPRIYHGLGKLNLKRQTYSLAEKYLNKSLKMQKELEEPSDLETAKVLTHLGELYQAKGKIDLAKQNYEEALSTLESLEPKEYKLQTQVMEQLANIAADNQDLDAAQDYKKRITELQLSHAKSVMSALPWVNVKKEDEGQEDAEATEGSAAPSTGSQPSSEESSQDSGN